jgi:MFS family permease
MHFAQALFYMNAVIWLVFAIASIAGILIHNPEQALMSWLIAILMLGNAAALLLSGVLMPRSGRPGFLFALAVVLANIMLTFTDQFGTLDLITLLMDLLLLVLLLLGRKSLSQPAGEIG